jgi:hypothetical protein
MGAVCLPDCPGAGGLACSGHGLALADTLPHACRSVLEPPSAAPVMVKLGPSPPPRHSAEGVALVPANMVAEDEPMGATTSQPTGTVTFLFTEIEGSTQLWEQDPDAMRQTLARQGCRQ